MKTTTLPLTVLSLSLLLSSTSFAATDSPKHSPNIIKHLERVYAKELRKFDFQALDLDGVTRWQSQWRPVLRELVGLNQIERVSGKHQPTVTFEAEEKFDGFTRRKGVIVTEPHVRIPFWLFVPHGDGPFPLAILPHGHDRIGHDTYAGAYHSEDHRQKSLAQDRDVAVQAAQRGFIAIAPAVRGLSVDGVPDVYERHDKRDCRSHLMHCLLGGRTAIGERVWDMQRIIDWAVKLPKADSKRILMMGNSGGGFVTMYSAALDPRITVAVPSCSFDKLVSAEGRIYQCDCNTVPRILEYGGMAEVVGLIAPRHLLIVNGHGDSLHDDKDIMEESAKVRHIYRTAGVEDHFDHRWGDDGHRFYKDLMWPFVMNAILPR